ncbi:MAG: hypothetical protein MRY59_09775, partial [Aquisalinus sp.]|nr:hypothetical protein [Aquisalinus sp.]
EASNISAKSSTEGDSVSDKRLLQSYSFLANRLAPKASGGLPSPLSPVKIQDGSGDKLVFSNDGSTARD